MLYQGVIARAFARSNLIVCEIASSESSRNDAFFIVLSAKNTIVKLYLNNLFSTDQLFAPQYIQGPF